MKVDLRTNVSYVTRLFTTIVIHPEGELLMLVLHSKLENDFTSLSQFGCSRESPAKTLDLHRCPPHHWGYVACPSLRNFFLSVRVKTDNQFPIHPYTQLSLPHVSESFRSPLSGLQSEARGEPPMHLRAIPQVRFVSLRKIPRVQIRNHTMWRV